MSERPSRQTFTDATAHLVDALSALLSRHDLNHEQREGVLHAFAMTLALASHVREHDEATTKERLEADDRCRDLVRLVAGSQINLAGEPRKGLVEEQN